MSLGQGGQVRAGLGGGPGGKQRLTCSLGAGRDGQRGGVGQKGPWVKKPLPSVLR